MATPCSSRPKHCDGGDAEHDGDQHRRHLRREGPEREDQRQRHDADDQRRQTGVVELAHQLRELAEEAGAAALDSEQLRELADGDDQGEAGHEAGQHRAREEVGDEPGAREAGGEQQRADEQGEQRREGDEAAAVAEGERRDGGRRVRRDRRARPDRQLPAGAQDGVGEQRRQRGEEPGLGRHTGERGVRHALRHEHGPHRRRRDQVRAQPAALVVRQPVADGQRRWFQPVPAHKPRRHTPVLLVGARQRSVAGGILRPPRGPQARSACARSPAPDSARLWVCAGRARGTHGVTLFHL